MSGGNVRANRKLRGSCGGDNAAYHQFVTLNVRPPAAILCWTPRGGEVVIARHLVMNWSGSKETLQLLF